MAMPNDAGEHHGEPAAAASGDPSTVAATSIDPSTTSHDDAKEQRIHSEAVNAQPSGASSAKPGLPRAAILTWRPDDRPGAPGPETIETAQRARAGGRRFALLAAGLT